MSQTEEPEIKGEPVKLKEADDDFEATPKLKDMETARKLLKKSPLLKAMFEANADNLR